MATLDGWDWALLVVAGYVATVSLVHLMRGYRDSVLRQLSEQLGKHSTAKRSDVARSQGRVVPRSPTSRKRQK